MKNITLKEIAEKLNISVTTVSKALKDYKDISDATKKKVKETAKELNYKPNAFAVNLRTRESKTIGLIIPEIVHHFFSSVVNGIVEYAEKKGYLVIILQSNESFKLEKKQINLLVGKNVDGVLISLANGTDSFSHIQEVIDSEIPLVMFDKIAKVINCSKVIINDREAAYNATKHLIDTGCKNIAHFGGPLEPQNSIDRFLGYKKALEDHGYEYKSSRVYRLKRMSFAEGYTYAEKIHKEHPDIDGIFINTDLVSLGAIKYFNDHHIKVPDEISIVGFSNWFMSTVVTPSLTTIHQPGYKIGKTACKLLLKQIKNKKEGKKIKIVKKELATSLIKRESTRPIN